ncbi:MAG: helix-turn-helix domain-containing protein [Bacteriovoracaceae bacterium]
MKRTREDFLHLTGQLLKAVRAMKGINQSQLATILKISQSKISKIESGNLELSAIEYVGLCRYADINFDCIEKGYIDVFHQRNGLGQQGTISRTPQTGNAFKSRFLMPYVQFAKVSGFAVNELVGLSDLELILLDSEIPNAKVVELIKDERFGSKSFRDFYKENFKSDLFHGEIHHYLENSLNTVEVFKKYFEVSDQYESVLNKKIVYSDEKRLDFEVTPGDFWGDNMVQHLDFFYSNLCSYGGEMSQNILKKSKQLNSTLYSLKVS